MKDFNFKRFFDLSVDMLCIADLDGHFLEVNDAFTRILGYPKSIILSDKFFTLIHPDDIEKTQAEMEKLKRGEVTIQFENRYMHKEGHYLTISWSSHVDKETMTIFATARDVTAQRNQEAKLSQIESALNSASIIAETDRKGIITSVNDKFCEISGYSRTELLGKTHKVVNSRFHDRAFFSNMWKTISSKNVWSGVIKNKKKNEDYYYVHTIIIPITDHEKNIISFLSIRQDITQSIKTESELARTLDILNETNAIAKVGGWELDVATGELTWTDETFRILEVDRRESRKPILPEGIDLFVPEHKPVIENAVSRAIEYGEPYSLTLKAKTAKGNVLWVYTNGRANYKNGKIVTLSGTIQDIDEQKKTEIKYNEERQKSIQSAKLASLGELAASMAHEINNPLGIISGYSELMLLSKDLSDANNEKLNIVLKSCQRISHIVNNLKKFSRQDEDLKLEKACLSEIIEESISLAKPRLKRHIVELSFNRLPEAYIKCTPMEIEQVFLNLINNSIDAIDKQDNRFIEIQLTDKANSIECKVIDSGHGIPDKIRENIFDPFYTSKEVGKGTGLGLSIVSDILTAHGATIEYDASAPSTSFILTFPKFG